ncbi:hypothetical protein [Luteococcus sp.]|uniref:hypothetical protein n=1 Tax=Luteococcus sp. TaxID=1969402 RepID=UPI003735E94D
MLVSHSRTVSGLRTMSDGNTVVRLDEPLPSSEVGDFLTRLGEADGVARVEVDRKMYADAGHQHGHPARRRSRGTDEGQPSPR